MPVGRSRDFGAGYLHEYFVALVVGNYVYIDGGEIAILVDDEPVNMPSMSPYDLSSS